MTYQQTIEYLYSQLPMFSRIGAAAYKPNLNNTIALCTSIGNPQTKFKTIPNYLVQILFSNTTP